MRFNTRGWDEVNDRPRHPAVQLHCQSAVHVGQWIYHRVTACGLSIQVMLLTWATLTKDDTSLNIAVVDSTLQ